jgi:hypothetical protein
MSFAGVMQEILRSRSTLLNLKTFFERKDQMFALDQNFDLFLAVSDVLKVATWLKYVGSEMSLADARLAFVENREK